MLPRRTNVFSTIVVKGGKSVNCYQGTEDTIREYKINKNLGIPYNKFDGKLI